MMLSLAEYIMYDNTLYYLILQNYGTVSHDDKKHQCPLASTWSKAIWPFYGKSRGVVDQALG